MKRLTLSDADRKIGGVCGGIGEYLEVDPTVVRLVTIVLALATAVVPLAAGYVIAWLIIPRRTPS